MRLLVQRKPRFADFRTTDIRRMVKIAEAMELEVNAAYKKGNNYAARQQWIKLERLKQKIKRAQEAWIDSYKAEEARIDSYKMEESKKEAK